MRLAYTRRALRTLGALRPEIRAALYKQTKFLLLNIHHPSLHAKKYDESRDLWQARVNRDWRFFFKIVADTYIIEDVTPHPK